MSNIEMQLDAIRRCILADSEDERERVRTQLRALAGVQPEEAIPVSVERMITEILLDIGIPCHVKGYRYLVTAIGTVLDNPELMNSVVKELYRAVASAHNTTPSRVERAIRVAIECGWDRGDIDILSHYFGNTVSADKGRPTNSEFIARVVDIVRLKLKTAA